MKQLALCTVVFLGLGSTVLADDRNCDFTAIQKPISVLSKPFSAIKGDPRVCDTMPPPRHSVWQSIQDPLDRSYGRIEDQATYEVGWIERSRLPQREFEILSLQRERELRLDDQRRRLDQLDQRQQRRELDRREYLLNLYGGLSPMARQAEADRLALDAAKAERDQALIDASNALNQSLQQPRADRARLKAEYEQARRQIRRQYEQTRRRILGD